MSQIDRVEMHPTYKGCYFVFPTPEDEESERKIAVRIKASEDLLEACKNTRFVINSNPDLHYLRSEPWFEMLNAAIAKATA